MTAKTDNGNGPAPTEQDVKNCYGSALTFPEALALQRKLSKLLQETPEFKNYQFGITERQEGRHPEKRWFIVEIDIPIYEGDY